MIWMVKLNHRVLCLVGILVGIALSCPAAGDEKRLLDEHEFVALIKCNTPKEAVLGVKVLRGRKLLGDQWQIKRDFGNMMFDAATKSMPKKHSRCVVYGSKTRRLIFGVIWLRGDGTFDFMGVACSSRKLAQLAEHEDEDS